jgi:hypothetical protein
VKDLLNKTGVTPKQVGIIITNCSLFNPTPSLGATIMNHFGMGTNTLNYNLGGMGCSGGWFGGGARRARGDGGRRPSAPRGAAGCSRRGRGEGTESRAHPGPILVRPPLGPSFVTSTRKNAR